MSEGYTVDPDQARAATDALSGAPGQLWTAHNRADDVAGLQNQAKWGDQPAPLAFMEAYASRLTETASDLELLREQLRDYVAAMRATIEAFVNVDADIDADVQAQHTLQEEYQERLLEMPRPTLSSGASFGGGRTMNVPI